MNEKILKNITVAKEYIEKVKRLNNPNKKEFLQSEATYLSVSMALFIILNSFIEIGEEIIEIKQLQIAMSYREIFTILGNETIIEDKTSKFLIDAAKARNMIAHQYGTFDKTKIYELAQRIPELEQFIKEIIEYLNNI
ncbi:MAG: DUF86 domain-containing protein [Nanoarchaeales archaeon]|nr:DUF86 domain-containing protein [Nanoarchaeales archaeon]